MRLKKGDQTPLFSVEDYLGNGVNLGNFKGKKIMLSFFRDAACPFCNLRVHELIRSHSQLSDMGLVIITFFTSEKGQIEKYAGKQQPPFSVIADPEMTIYKKYMVESSKGGMFKAMRRVAAMVKMISKGFFNMKSMKEKPTVPADFLIDENLIVQHAHYGSDYGDHINIDMVKNWLENK